MPKGFRVTFEIDKLDPILSLIQGEVRGLRVEQIEDEPQRNEVVVRGVPIEQRHYERGPVKLPAAAFPPAIMQAAPKIIEAVRELQDGDERGRGAFYKDIAERAIRGGVSGIYKPTSISPILSALWRAGKLIRTQRGFYRVPH